MAGTLLRRWVLPAGLILVAGIVGSLAIAFRHDVLVERENGGPGDPSGEEPAPPPPDPEVPFSFIFGGELNGRLGSPPCSQEKQGGLARVSSVVQKMASRTTVSILMETGDIPCAEGEHGAVELATVMDIQRELGLAVAAVGEKDLLIGLDRWREVKNRSAGGIAVLCANLRDEEGEPLVPAVATFNVGKRRIHVTAILSPSFEPALRAAGIPVRLLPPVESLREALAAAGKADMVVLLSHAPVDESRELLRALPEVRLAVTAHAEERPWLEPEVVDGRLLMAPGVGWQYVSAARFQGRLAGGIDTIDTHLRPVSPKAMTSELAMMKLQEATMLLGAKGFLERTLGERAARYAGAPAFTGPATCATCHPAAHAKWSDGENPHAQAMDPVRKFKQDTLVYCLQCHATAPGYPGGHLERRDEQAAVTCEACHGNGAEHVALDGRAPLADPKRSCIRCHTTEIDPAFDYEADWPKIVHGR